MQNSESSRPTGFVTHSAYVEHETGAAHPERPNRLRAIDERLAAGGVGSMLARHEPRRATLAELAGVHRTQHIEHVQAVCERSPAALDGDTIVSPGSFDAALFAAGGVIDACERVLDGRWKNAFCAVRPPGHHAEADRSMGFCLFNNIAVATRWLLEQGLERIAILDWDVHHGNGTQHVFESDPRVFFASLHQWPLYPGTGAATERGTGDGEGATLNRPMDAGSTDADWIRELDDAVLPELEAFRPEFVLVSAGFDAHRLDPLAGVELTEDGYRCLSQRVLELANRSAAGRVVSVLEGGYHLAATSASVEAHLEELVAAADVALPEKG